MKLQHSTLYQLDSQLKIPNYDKTTLTQGIVHIGVGGFHRAHQAVYTNNLLMQPGCDSTWGICGVGLRDSDKKMQQALENQDYLYSVVELSHNQDNNVSIIGAINEFLFAPENPEAVLEKLSDPTIKIVSLTITEGGYNIDDSTGQFNTHHPDIAYDLLNPKTPKTVFGYLSMALNCRRKLGIKPFTVVSCDNLPHNGDVIKKALLSFVELYDLTLKRWIADNVAFPNSMVDRITPTTSETHKQWLNNAYQLDDKWPVVCEPFSQWVIEDNFCNERPEWERVGVQFTSDVTPYELAKIRLLNASHTAMAYLGYLSGYQFVHEVMADNSLLKFIRDFMDQDVTPTLGDLKEINIEDYKRLLISRFSNQKIGDQIERLCLDGQNKMPKFLIPIINDLIPTNLSLDRTALIVASWARYLLNDNKCEKIESDPASIKLQNIIKKDNQSIDKFLELNDIFGHKIIKCDRFVQLFNSYYIQLGSEGVAKTLDTYHRKGQLSTFEKQTKNEVFE